MVIQILSPEIRLIMPTDFVILFSNSSLKDNFRNETIITVFQGFQNVRKWIEVFCM